MTTDQRVGYGVAVAGLLLMLAVAVAYLYQLLAAPAAPAVQGYLFPVVVGIGMAWWGFAWAKPKRARDNGQFVRDTVEEMRGGRRGYDAPVPVAPPTQSEEVHRD